MRLSVASLQRMVNGKLHIEFVRQELTSYSGLELLRRHLRQLDLPRRLRVAWATTNGDYGGGRLALILALVYVGTRRLEQLRYLGSNPADQVRRSSRMRLSSHGPDVTPIEASS